MTSRPLVSIVIVSKDQTVALQRCVESLLEKTAYSEYELLLVDNGSESAEARAWLDGMAQLGSERIRVLTYRAARQRRGGAQLRRESGRVATTC